MKVSRQCVLGARPAPAPVAARATMMRKVGGRLDSYGRRRRRDVATTPWGQCKVSGHHVWSGGRCRQAR
uniref:Uncharacterized protein n=1 Tax=Arundo donax TaxID=35708 RepID=A0A0A9AMF2_ARUDO